MALYMQLGKYNIEAYITNLDESYVYTVQPRLSELAGTGQKRTDNQEFG